MGIEVGWNRDPPPGFRGLDPNRPITVYERHLPHWRQAGATYFVTFRLADSLPQAKWQELMAYRAEWERRHPPPRSNEILEQLWREMFRRVDGLLDQGYGSCRLRELPAQDIVANALQHFHEQRYDLGCFVVMPNHVHVVVRPFAEDDKALQRITHSWKSYTSQRMNELYAIETSNWQYESFDRIIRDEEHLWRTVQYVGNNPKKAGLNVESCRLWINPVWEKCGWRFE